MATGDTPWKSPSRDAVMRYLLGSAATRPLGPKYSAACLDSVNALSRKSGIAYSWVHKVLTALEGAKLIELDPIEVLDVKGTYRWWAERRNPSEGYGFHVPDPLQALDALRGARVPPDINDLDKVEPLPVLVTTYYAEVAYASHLFPRKLDVYVPADLTFHASSVVEDGDFVLRARRLLLDRVGAMLGGTNLRVLSTASRMWNEAPEPLMYKGHEIPVAPLPQVIVDLYQEGGSAAEAADLLIARSYHA